LRHGALNDCRQTVDALAHRGEEGRTRLRKAAGSCQEALIRRFPNGATHCMATYSIHIYMEANPGK